MPSNREAFFEAKKYIKENILTERMITSLIKEVNGFSSSFELSKNYDKEMSNYSLFMEYIKRICNGEMMEYVLNKAEFLGRSFYVDKNVLIPRQETEQLVAMTNALLTSYYKGKKITLADVCTGSGVIGISLAYDLANAKIYLSDISKEACEIAKRNCLAHGFDKITIFNGDMLKPLVDKNVRLDVLVCNPPYISNIEGIDKRTWEQEPHLALLAEPSYKFYEEIFMNHQKVMNDNFVMAFEIGEDMSDDLTKLIEKYLPNAKYSFLKDMYGKERFLFIIEDDVICMNN